MSKIRWKKEEKNPIAYVQIREVEKQERRMPRI